MAQQTDADLLDFDEQSKPEHPNQKVTHQHPPPATHNDLLDLLDVEAVRSHPEENGQPANPPDSDGVKQNLIAAA